MSILDRDFFTDPEILEDPRPYYAALRAHGPVFREPHKGVYVLSHVDPILEVYTDHERFSAIVGRRSNAITIWSRHIPSSTRPLITPGCSGRSACSIGSPAIAVRQ